MQGRLAIAAMGSLPMRHREGAMLRDITDAIPPPILLGLIAYGALAAVLAPEMTIRFGQKSAVPHCLAGMEARQPGLDGDDIGREVARSILGFASDYLRGSRAGVAAGHLADRLYASAGRGSHASPEARCQCLLKAAAFDSQVRFDGTLWVGSFRFVEGSGISALAGHMTRKRREGFCEPEGSQ